MCIKLPWRRVVFLLPIAVPDPAGLTWSGLDVDDDLALLALLAAAAGC